MPSSVVFAALVLAWLVVLVPLVARRRQMVPRPAEADLSAKVLPRGAVGPAMERIAVKEHPVANAAHPRHAHSARGAHGATALAERDVEVTDELDRELDLEAHDDTASRERVLDRGPVDGPAHEDDAAYDDGAYLEEAWDDGASVEEAWGDAAYDDVEYEDAYAEDGSSEPRAYRPGRGGFDPEAAEVAAHARYSFRQRVALGLIAVAVLSALAALVVTPVLWSLHVVTDLVLVGYLVFLRRQTRIEEEVRARRAARLSGERRALAARRERQAEHDDYMDAHRRDAGEWGAWGDEHIEDGAPGRAAEEADRVDEHGVDDVDDEEPRWAAPRTPAPPVPDGMELVDDSEDDPAFHRLDDRDATPAYRRAAAGA